MATDANTFILEVDKKQDTLNYGNGIKPIYAKPPNSTGVIDVMDYRIFANDMNESLKSQIPYVYVQEMDLLSNTLANSIAYYLNIASGNIGDAKRFYQGLTSAETNSANEQAKNDEPGFLNKYVLSPAKQGLSDLASGAYNLAAKALDETKRVVSSKVPIGSAFDEILVGAGLRPYSGLYQVRATGFNYIFPYFDDKKYDVNNEFTENFNGIFGSGGSGSTGLDKFGKFGNIFKASSDLLKSAAETYLSYTTITEPAAYVEVPKYYAPGPYEEITVKFDLLNTYSFSDVQKNYDLLFLLAFQNLPFRQDLVKIKPPKLYVLTIPGQTTLPFCHIKNIKVDYIGNRRILKGKIKKYTLDGQNSLSRTEQDVIIPDCYRVSITFVSLVKPAANLLLTPDINVRFGSTPGAIVTPPIVPLTTTTNSTSPNTFVNPSNVA